VSRSRCAAPWSSIQILADGSAAVLGRCFQVTMGDLRSQTIAEIWNGERYTAFRETIGASSWWPACVRCCGTL
jgi:hypothetical protein